MRYSALQARTPPLTFDPYILFLLGLGLIVLLVSWAPIGLKRLPLTLAILCVGIGLAVFSTGLLAFDPDPRTWDTATEKLTELVVIISLMGCGLKLDRPPGLKSWAVTWRLLAVAMPLTIAAVAFLGVWGLGFALPMALLLGASMAPTDPVLAFLGIRGVGSVYYVAYGINHGDFGNSERLWSIVGFVILASILIHGVTATPLLDRLARWRGGGGTGQADLAPNRANVQKDAE